MNLNEEIDSDGTKSNNNANRVDGISARRIPYPYEAMLAICSDLDETTDRHVYFEIMRFLNTTEQTEMGTGVGLEVGNTMYFDMPPDQFAYWNTDDHGRAMIRELIISGHIDCLHSFGDYAITRSHAERTLEELSRQNCRLEVWIDHGTAPSNFGKDIMRGQGDVIDSEVYHADLTYNFGIRYVSLGRVTSIIGQDTSRSLKGLFRFKNPFTSSRTVLKEAIKGLYPNLGNSKYAMHAPNRVLRKLKLRDGKSVYEFIRSNPHYGGVSYGETADGLADVLTEPILNRLAERKGICILYTHLGKSKNPDGLFCNKTKKALRNLSKLYLDGKILVTTTNRVLRYSRAIREIDIACYLESDKTMIQITSSLPIESLNGLTLYVEEPKKTSIFLNGSKVENANINAPDRDGRSSVSFPWNSLYFPEIK